MRAKPETERSNAPPAKKDDSCEVYSSGTVPSGKRLKNRPVTFPSLDLERIRAQAKIWGKKFPLIERIMLYRAVTEGPERDAPPFVLAVDVPDVKSPRSKGRDARLDQTVNSWQPDSLRFRIDQECLEGFGKNRDDIINKWIVVLREPGEEIIDVDSDRCWVLFDRNPAAKASLPEKVLELARLARAELDEFYRVVEHQLKYELDIGEWSGEDRTPGIWKKQTLKVFMERKSSFQFINKRMLEADELYLGSEKRARSFIQHLLGAIVEDHGLGSWSTQDLYVESGPKQAEKAASSKNQRTRLTK